MFIAPSFEIRVHRNSFEFGYFITWLKNMLVKRTIVVFMKYKMYLSLVNSRRLNLWQQKGEFLLKQLNAKHLLSSLAVPGLVRKGCPGGSYRRGGGNSSPCGIPLFYGSRLPQRSQLPHRRIIFQHKLRTEIRLVAYFVPIYWLLSQ